MTAMAEKKGGTAPFLIPKCTDRIFLRYRYGKYREIPTEYRPKIPNQYTTLVFTFWIQNVYVLDPESSVAHLPPSPISTPDLAISIRTHIFSSPILVLEAQNLEPSRTKKNRSVRTSKVQTLGLI